MGASIVSKSDKELVIQINVTLESSMLKTEESIQQSLNQAGCQATKMALSNYDSNGDPIMVHDLKYTSKGLIEKKYQTPYGEIKLHRNVYQSSQGGKTYCPLENDARIIVYSTPKFAKMVSSKYSSIGGRFVQKDLIENHGRYISRNYIKNISDTVGEIALEKVKKWKYLPPVSPEIVKSIGLGLDGTCMFMADNGWRQAMVGTIAFFGKENNRFDTIYLSAPPEYGKTNFIENFENEINSIKKIYVESDYIGIADGAKDNWTFLSKHTNYQILDFFHASEYVTKVAEAVYSRNKEKRSKWLSDSCHKLKHEKNGAKELLNEFIGYRQKRLNAQKKEKLESSITYFTNQISKMKYSEYIEKNYPIGSGVTEAACKVIVKQRLCNSGMKWKQRGAGAVLCLRALNYSSDRWGQTWMKISRYGL
ncbi:MAG: ISKra4 family transposase [Candidatus Marinimicrobia bacterium]|nr:ISKra4 family transposase [Candidatus Neomarinimicrobiota bacterium]